MMGASWMGTWVKRSVAPVLANESPSSFPEIPAWPGTHWKLTATQGSRKGPKYPEGFWLEKRWGRGEEGKGRLFRNWLGKRPIKSGKFSNGCDTIPGHVQYKRFSWEARGDRASWVGQREGGWASSAGRLNTCTSGAQRRGFRAIGPYDQTSDVGSPLKKSAAASGRSGSEKEQP